MKYDIKGKMLYILKLIILKFNLLKRLLHEP